MKPKRILKRLLRILAIILAIPLALIVLLTAVPFAASIGLQQEPLPPDPSTNLRNARIGERWMIGLARAFNAVTPMPKYISSEYDGGHFYSGGESEGEAWQLGYAQAIITPEDWETKTYYGGGNIPTLKLNKKLDELKVRVIALSADEGDVNIFAAADCIGMTNRQVRQVRALVADLNLQSVNIAATHTHSAVDTLGMYSRGGDDEAYIAFMNDKIAGAVRAAVAAMEPGKLYISQIGRNELNMGELYDRNAEAIGLDWDTVDWDTWDEVWSEKWKAGWNALMEEIPAEEFGLGDMVYNKRQGTHPSTLNRLRFAPEDPASRETLLLNFAAHPCYMGMKYQGWAGDVISGDFPYYMEEAVNAAGMDMVFFNGAVNGIYYDWDSREQAESVRQAGRDFAQLALNMAETTAETELPPKLDVRLRELTIDVENPIMRWVSKVRKSNYPTIRDGKNLKIPTELGYAELGGLVTIALLPGEITPGLAWGGGDTLAENAIRMRDFEARTLSEIAGREVLVFGLCNDELGYIVPGNDYVQFFLPIDNLMWRWIGGRHYQELLSPGPRTASVVSEAFAGLFDEQCITAPAPQ